MRGASALGDEMKDRGTDRIEWIVIWEPVVKTDVGPPSRKLTAEVRGARIFWDPKLETSDAILAAARAAGLPPEKMPEPGEPAWDVVFVFPAGVRWDDSFPMPAWHGYPVVEHVDGLRTAIDAALAK